METSRPYRPAEPSLDRSLFSQPEQAAAIKTREEMPRGTPPHGFDQQRLAKVKEKSEDVLVTQGSQAEDQDLADWIPDGDSGADSKIIVEDKNIPTYSFRPAQGTNPALKRDFGSPLEEGDILTVENRGDNLGHVEDQEPIWLSSADLEEITDDEFHNYQTGIDIKPLGLSHNEVFNKAARLAEQSEPIELNEDDLEEIEGSAGDLGAHDKNKLSDVEIKAISKDIPNLRQKNTIKSENVQVASVDIVDSMEEQVKKAMRQYVEAYKAYKPELKHVHEKAVAATEPPFWARFRKAGKQLIELHKNYLQALRVSSSMKKP